MPIDFDKFWSDPKHQPDRDFFQKSFDKCFDEKMKKKREKLPPKQVNLFDSLFGGIDDPSDEDTGDE